MPPVRRELLDWNPDYAGPTEHPPLYPGICARCHCGRLLTDCVGEDREGTFRIYVDCPDCGPQTVTLTPTPQSRWQDAMTAILDQHHLDRSAVIDWLSGKQEKTSGNELLR